MKIASSRSKFSVTLPLSVERLCIFFALLSLSKCTAGLDGGIVVLKLCDLDKADGLF